MDLNDSYDHVRSQILMKKSLLSLSEVYNILDQEDSQRSARTSSQAGVDASAFQVSSNAPYGKSKPVRTHCGGFGHTVDSVTRSMVIHQVLNQEESFILRRRTSLNMSQLLPMPYLQKHLTRIRLQYLLPSLQNNCTSSLLTLMLSSKITAIHQHQMDFFLLLQLYHRLAKRLVRSYLYIPFLSLACLLLSLQEML